MILDTEKQRESNWKNNDWVAKKINYECHASQAYKTERMELWQSLDRLYRQRQQYYYKNRSNLFVPVIFWNIENIVPRWAGVQQRIIYLPENDASFVPQGPVMTRFWDYQWRKMRGTMQLVELLKIALKYGLAIYKPYWERDIRPTYRWKPFELDGMPIGDLRIPEQTTLTVHDGPKGEVIPPWMFFWDPDGTDIDPCLWCSYITNDRLGNLAQDDKYNLKVFTDKNQGADTSLWKMEYWRDDRMVVLATEKDIDHSEKEADTGEQKIELERGTDENWRVIRNEKRNPLWAAKKPFLKVVDYPIEKKFFGLSTAEVLESSQAEMNALRNLRMDHSVMTLQPPTLVGQRARLKQFKMGPGAVLNVLDTKEVQQMKLGDLKNAGVAEVNELHKDIQRIVGTNDFIEGGNVQPSRTPGTTLEQINQAGSVRIAFKSMLLANTFFVDLSTWHRHLNRQFMSRKQAFGVGGPAARHYLDIPPEVWEQEWDVYPVVVGADEHTPQAKTAAILGFVNSIAPILDKAHLLEGQGVQARKIIEQIMYHYQGLFDNPAEIMIPEEQWQMQQQQQALQAQQAMPQPAAPGGQPAPPLRMAQIPGTR